MALVEKQCAQCAVTFSGDVRYTFQRYCSVKCRKRFNQLNTPLTTKQKVAKSKYQRKVQATPEGKKAMRDYQREWNRKNPEKVKARLARRRVREMATLHAIKSASGCVDCGFNEHPAALQFDHVRGKKVCAVSDFNSVSPRALAEIKKCDVRCANCHSIKHYEDKKPYGSLASAELLDR